MKFRIGNKRKNKVVGFSGVLPDIIKELDIEDSFLIEAIKSIWPGVVGEILATHSIPGRIFKKTLFVSVDHSVYANELMMMRNTILEKIEEELAVDIIKNLKAEIKRLKW
ncbi:MAG: DUF721 domain-containing protein [bacterium]|nr:DUF721 domain-containing protein [bacterium]